MTEDTQTVRIYKFSAKNHVLCNITIYYHLKGTFFGNVQCTIEYIKVYQTFECTLKMQVTVRRRKKKWEYKINK